VLGTSLFVKLLGDIAQARSIEKKVAVYEKEVNEPLTIGMLQELDEDRSGKVEKSEYVLAMLKRLDAVDPMLLETLEQRFDELDVDHSGSLDQDDLRRAV